MSSVLRTLVHVCIVLAMCIEAWILAYRHVGSSTELDLIRISDYSLQSSLNESAFFARFRTKNEHSFKLHYKLPPLVLTKPSSEEALQWYHGRILASIHIANTMHTCTNVRKTELTRFLARLRKHHLTTSTAPSPRTAQAYRAQISSG